MLALRADGLELAYERRGDGPPLVLVHGAAEDHRTWRSQMELADVCTLVAWDEPGCGRSSDPADDIELAGLAHALAALVETVAPAHVLGFSWGGTIVLELYRQRPDLVASLVLVDTYAGWRGSLPQEEVDARVAAVSAALAAPGEVDPTVPGLFAGPPPAEAAGVLAEMAADVRVATLRRSLALMAAADLSDVLPTIAVPTLLLWGGQDVRSPMSVARAFAGVIPGARLVVLPGVGHAAHLEQPAAFNAAVRGWLAEQPDREPG